MAQKQLNSRERFQATFNYTQPDHVFLMSQWTFNDTRQRWLREGIPWDAHFNAYFGYDRMEMIPLNAGIWPPLETKVVEQTAQWCVIEDEFGGLTKRWSDREVGMSQWIRYPVRDQDTWERWKKRLNPEAPNRYPQYWDDLKRCYRGRDYPLGVHVGSYYGWIRNWVGMENLALWYYDCPNLVHEMTEFIADFILRLIRRAIDEVSDIDYAVIWEDMAMKSGPLISPAQFKEFMMRPLKVVTKTLNEYGIKIIMVDSDGNVDELIPLWLEANVNLVYPLEVASNCDAVRYRKEFGKPLLMIGNIDKRVLREGCSKKEIEAEVMSKVPQLVKDGGFSPMVDHAVPPDVPFENFKYYMDLVHQVCSFSFR
jgi:uroporphyrinogen decarboxylase